MIGDDVFTSCFVDSFTGSADHRTRRVAEGYSGWVIVGASGGLKSGEAGGGPSNKT